MTYRSIAFRAPIPTHPYSNTTLFCLASRNMAFVLRRPFAIANTIKQEAPRISRTTFRSFQTQASAPLKQTFVRPSTPLRTFASKENAFLNSFRQSAKRTYQTSQAPVNPVAQGNITQRLIYGGKRTTTPTLSNQTSKSIHTNTDLNKARYSVAPSSQST